MDGIEGRDQPDPTAYDEADDEVQPRAGPSKPRPRPDRQSARTPVRKPIATVAHPPTPPSRTRRTPTPATTSKVDEAKGKRTPLARASPAANRARPVTPSKQPSAKGKERAVPTSTKRARVSVPSPSPVKRPGTNVPLSSAKRRKGAAGDEPPAPPPEIDDMLDDLEDEEEVVVDENGYIRLPAAPVSRETFLANEKLRRQREARNFKYTGSADAPKLTRSGRVIGEVDKTEEEEYGTVDEDDPFVDRPIPSVPIEDTPELEVDGLVEEREDPEMEMQQQAKEILPLPPGGEACLRGVLDTLTGRNIAYDPPPFVDEEKNEALNGLVNLLKGTVERGEGNSALVVGARGVGKTRTVARALNLLPSTSSSAPIVVRLSGLAQTNDRLAIREMGRQIAEAEGKMVAADEDDEEIAEDAEYAPTTLPSHLLALLTAPSPRAIIIIIEEFDLFTEHARQALLYCLLDVVQSVKTGSVTETGRGVAVIGVTSRVDTLLLLEKRVKSRFSHRMWRVLSPLAPEGTGWRETILRAVVPWRHEVDDALARSNLDLAGWKDMWAFAIETLLDNDKVIKSLERLCGLTTDVRVLYRPFILPIAEILAGASDFISVPEIRDQIISQLESASWGLANRKLKGLPQPAVGVLIIAKHLSYIGRDDFTFAMVEEEYLRFGRTKLVGSGRTRWPLTVLRSGFDHLLRMGLLVPAGTGNVQPRFAKVRCTLSPHDVVAWMRGEGAAGLGPEMVGWGRMTGGHL